MPLAGRFDWTQADLCDGDGAEDAMLSALRLRVHLAMIPVPISQSREALREPEDDQGLS